MSKSTFSMSDKLGQMGEYVSLAHIQKKDSGASKAGTGYFPDGDIRLSNGDLVEVKTDLEMAKTGNHYIEVACDSKPSGLAITKSKWWFVVTATKIVICETNKVKEAMKTLTPITKYNDDGKFMMFYLLSKSALNDIKYDVIDHGHQISFEELDTIPE